MVVGPSRNMQPLPVTHLSKDAKNLRDALLTQMAVLKCRAGPNVKTDDVAFGVLFASRIGNVEGTPFMQYVNQWVAEEVAGRHGRRPVVESFAPFEEHVGNYVSASGRPATVIEALLTGGFPQVDSRTQSQESSPTMFQERQGRVVTSAVPQWSFPVVKKE